MRFYQEITLIENNEIPFFRLLSSVFQQIHLGLVESHDEHGIVPIGISFPDYVSGEKIAIIGGKIRLFAEHESLLINFNAKNWLAKFEDYVHCTKIRPVPSEIKGYSLYCREREKDKVNKAYFARRYAGRHDMSFEDALRYYESKPVKIKVKKQLRRLPFVWLRSLSTKNSFPLWINKISINETHEDMDKLAGRKVFSSYGLSSISAVPEF